MALPIKPPIKPQLARPAKDLPEDDGWRFEPKWDGFRTIVFRDGDDVHLQSRNGRPMNRYFPEVIPDVLSLPGDRLVLDGELIELLEPYRTHERGTGEPSRWKSDEELVWEGLRPELVCEVAFDHITGRRIRHGAKFLRWRPDKSPEECGIEQLRA